MAKFNFFNKDGICVVVNAASKVVVAADCSKSVPPTIPASPTTWSSTWIEPGFIPFLRILSIHRIGSGPPLPPLPPPPPPLFLFLFLLFFFLDGARCGAPNARQKDAADVMIVIKAPSSAAGGRHSAGDKYSMFHSLSNVGMSGLCCVKFTLYRCSRRSVVGVADVVVADVVDTDLLVSTCGGKRLVVREEGAGGARGGDAGEEEAEGSAGGSAGGEEADGGAGGLLPASFLFSSSFLLVVPPLLLLVDPLLLLFASLFFFFLFAL